MGAQLSVTGASRVRSIRWLWPLVTGILWSLTGLALARLLFEGLFPAGLWLGRLPGALFVAAVAGIAGVVASRRLQDLPRGLVSLLPLLLNLAVIFAGESGGSANQFIFVAGLWLTAVLIVWHRTTEAGRWRWLGPLFVVLALAPAYPLTMSHAVGAADAFEFQVVAPRLGIAHPTGYPLYLLLGKLFTLLPVGSVAWRLNLASAVYAVAAAVVLYSLMNNLLRQPLAALLGTVTLGLIPVYWSQAIIAEVYTLHALIVAIALWLMLWLLQNQDAAIERRRWTGIGLAFTIGLGLTNHLTTVFLMPPAAVLVAILLWDARRSPAAAGESSARPLWQYLLLLGLAFVLPLLLYAYLPLRWQVVNGEPMGLGRFVDWVAGGRFQGALQWGAWLRDATRYEIVGRLLLDNWSWVYLITAAAGLAYLFLRHRRAALILTVAGLGFAFYALNYYVPDLAVFLIPTHLVIAVLVAAGVAWVMAIRFGQIQGWEREWDAVVFLLFMLPAAFGAAAAWTTIDQSRRDGGEPWARGVLGQPLATGAAVLADSEKIAPLYYLQQTEGLRPDLDIMVLPDEAAYRAELVARVAAGQAVYLARFLPGLASSYYLRSAGPLTEASLEPLSSLPADVEPAALEAGPLRLLGYAIEPISAVDPTAAGITLYWQLAGDLPAGELPVIYLRWADDNAPATGRHAVGDSYPVNAWRPGEVVVDYHLLPLPTTACAAGAGSCARALDVAVGPRFTSPENLGWQTIAKVDVPVAGNVPDALPVQMQIGSFLLDAAAVPANARPSEPLMVRFSGIGDPADLAFALVPAQETDMVTGPVGGQAPAPAEGTARAYAVSVTTDGAAGSYALTVTSRQGEAALCGWLARASAGCVIGPVEVAGTALPLGATNFGDQIALLDVSIPDPELHPGGHMSLDLTWQALAGMSEDYTVFVQVLDAADQLVGQVDSWPVQGTYPTSQWSPGEVVRDPYIVRLDAGLPPGDYRLHVGLYLLATLERLPVLDATGAPVDDKLEVSGLAVSD